MTRGLLCVGDDCRHNAHPRGRREGRAAMAEQGRVRLKQVLFEFIRMGQAVKVNAIDPETGIEVSMVGDPKAGTETLKRLATRKLEYVIAKRLDQGAGGNGGG